MSESSCLGTGTWPEVIAKSKHEAGDLTIIRVTGGQHVWMPAEAAACVRMGTRLKVAGGGLPLQGLEHLGIERAMTLASDNSLFGEEDVEVDGDGLPICPDCHGSLNYESTGSRDSETMGGSSVEYLACEGCGETFELVNDPINGSRLYPQASSRGRSRGRVAVGALLEPEVNPDAGRVDVGVAGVAMARAGEGFEIVVVNPDPGTAAAVETALQGFGTASPAGENKWVIDTSRPFAGDIGLAYVSLVKLHRLISQRGVPPSLFRDLRDWVSGRP